MKVIKIIKSSHKCQVILYLLVPILMEQDLKAQEKLVEARAEEDKSHENTHYGIKWSYVVDIHSQVIALNNEFHRLVKAENITFEQIFTLLEAIKTVLMRKLR